MKRFFGFLGLLCAFFSAVVQENRSMVKGVGSGLRVGDRVPDVVLAGWMNGRAELGGKVRLADFKGKLVILDFWSTYCGACIQAMPGLDSLQRVFGDKLVVLPVAFEARERVLAFWKKNALLQALSLPSVVEDKELSVLFPHRLLPHDVWIDGNGVVLGFTEAREITVSRINAVLSGKGLDLGMKRDVLDYAWDKPLLVNGNGGRDGDFRYRSLMTGFLRGLPAGVRVEVDTLRKQIRVRATNVRPMVLYGLADKRLRYLPDRQVTGGARDRLVFEVKPGMGLDTAHLYGYELILPGCSVSLARRSIKEDLDRFFGVRTEWVESIRQFRVSPLEDDKEEAFTL
ncbi:MAG: TlpA family protein disulfide reductase [Mucilaginibacter sp.]|nr:TlpA family protein disulfide reductase [Mucilaginibacter sp.]